MHCNLVYYGGKRGTKMRLSGLSPKTGSCSGETGKLTSGLEVPA